MNNNVLQKIVESKKRVMLSLKTIANNELFQLSQLVDDDTKEHIISEFNTMTKSIQNVINILTGLTDDHTPNRYKYLIHINKNRINSGIIIYSHRNISDFEFRPDFINALVLEGVIDETIADNIIHIERIE